MSFRPCVSGCGRYIAPRDGHDRCVTCLGFQHAETAFVDGSCSHCGDMTISALRSRLDYLKRYRVPSATPRSSSSSRKRATSAGGQGDLRVTVWASPTSQPPRTTPPSHTPQPVEFPDEFAGPSQAPDISFGAREEDRMSIAASQGLSPRETRVRLRCLPRECQRCPSPIPS